MITEELVDRLVAATNEAKEVLPELHGAVKDLRRVISEAAAERRALEEVITSATVDGIDATVQAALTSMAATIERSVADAERTVTKRLQSDIRLGGLLPPPGAPAPGRRCPHCRKLIEASSGLGMALVPNDGDISICARCGGVSRFDSSTLTLRRETADEEQDSRSDEGIQTAVRAIKSVAKSKTRRR